MESKHEKEDASEAVEEHPPSLLKELPVRAIERGKRAYTYATTHWVRSLLCVVSFPVLALAVNLTAAFFITFALVMLLMGLDSRISIIPFMICLAICPLLLAIDRDSAAGKVAVWAYYFLAIGVIVQLVSLVREKWAAGRLDVATGAYSVDKGMVPAEGKKGMATGIKRVDQAISFLRENFISAIGYMVIATFAGNFLNYLFNVVAGRLLGHDLYGEFAALLSVFIIVTVPITSLSAMVAKKVAEFRMVNDRGGIREISVRCLQICLFSAIAVALVFLVFGRSLAGYLHISSVIPVVACGLAVAITIPQPVFYGVMQGFQWFIWLGSLFFGYAAGRFVFGWLFIKMGWGVSGALLGGALGSIIVLVISAYVIRGVFTQERSAKRLRLRDIGRSYLPFIISNSIFFLLVSIDTIIVKRKFPSSIAGDYASAAFMGKIILYFPSSVGIVLFPKLVEAHVAGKDTRRLLRMGILIVLTGSLAISAVFIAFPRFTVTTLYGAEYIGAASILWIISLAMSCYTVVGMFMYYFLATEETRFLIVALTACAVPGILAMYFVASTSFQVALVELVISVLFVAAAFFRIGRMSAGRTGNAI
jgi:O-antigen/teichoic acid export membrane protein